MVNLSDLTEYICTVITTQVGVRRTVYSWRLVGTDKLLTGKKACEPLQEIEKRLNRDMEDGIHTFVAREKTLNDFFEKYMEIRPELKSFT